MKERGRKLLLFLIDCSGSMEGLYLSAINASMVEILELFRAIPLENGFVTGAIVFSEHAKWVNKNKLSLLEEFQWEDIYVGKTSEFGKALELAKEVLDVNVLNEFGCSPEAEPIIVYVGDGRPTDKYWESLRKIKQNVIFDRSKKLALTTGAMIDREMLMSFTGNFDTLIPLNDIESIKRFVMQ